MKDTIITSNQPGVYPVHVRGNNNIDFIVYEKPSANGVTRVQGDIDPVKHKDLFIGALVDADCVPLKIKTAADVTGKASGVSLVAVPGIAPGFNSMGEPYTVYIRRFGAWIVELKDTVIDTILEGQLDASVTAPATINTIRAAIVTELERLQFGLVPTGV